MPLITVTDLSNHLRRDLSADTAVQDIVDGANAVVCTFAEQTFNTVTDETIILDGTGTDALLLPERPVLDVSAVVENDVALTATTHYKLKSNGILIRVPGWIDEGWGPSIDTGWAPRIAIAGWRKGRQNISVTYSHGYADADLPRDVRLVALTYATRLLTQGSDVSFEQLGEWRVRYNFPGDFTAIEKAILRRYKQSK